MKLYVMRHGPAADDAPNKIDADRELTDEGRARVRAVARALAKENEAPLTFVTSPLARCLQTAEIAYAALNAFDTNCPLFVRRELAPGGRTMSLLAELRSAKKRRVLLVGHEPDMSTLVSNLVGHHVGRGFAKAMVVGLSIANEGDGWGAVFRFRLDPKTLAWEKSANTSTSG